MILFGRALYHSYGFRAAMKEDLLATLGNGCATSPPPTPHHPPLRFDGVRVARPSAFFKAEKIAEGPSYRGAGGGGVEGEQAGEPVAKPREEPARPAFLGPPPPALHRPLDAHLPASGFRFPG